MGGKGASHKEETSIICKTQKLAMDRLDIFLAATAGWELLKEGMFECHPLVGPIAKEGGIYKLDRAKTA